jgi:hypothetical protein
MNLNVNLHWRNMWRLWAKAIGEKAHKKDDVADKVAIIRTFIFATYLITNAFIVAGVIRHWNDQTEILVEIHQEQPVVPNIRTISNQRVFE